jgi:hypothetical protein
MKQRRFGVLGAVLMLVLVGGALIWWANSRTNEDPLWFLRTFKPEAAWIVIYWEGETHMLFPGDTGYEPIMQAFARGIGHWKDYEDNVELSDEDLKVYRDRGCLLELHYDRRIQVHTRHPYPEARTFFVPLTGNHATSCRIFAGMGDRPRAGVLTMEDVRFESLADAIETSLAPHLTDEP